MKTSLLLIAIVSAFTVSAHAGNFKCELEQMGSALASEEAPYNVFEASASANGFVCEGSAQGDTTTVKLTDLSSGQVATDSQKNTEASAYLSTVPRHNEYDVNCTCGMK